MIHMKTAALRIPLFLLFVLAMLAPLSGVAQERDGEGERDRRAELRERWENASEEEREKMREEMRARWQEREAERSKQQAEQMRERLGMSEEDFEAIAPMIEKVRNLLRERERATRGSRGGQRGDRGGSDTSSMSDQGKAMTEAMSKLREAIEDDNSGKIKAGLKKLREARAAMDKTVKEAREELRSVCSAKWEAEFVVMGLLD